MNAKSLLNTIALLVVSPLGFLTWLEQRFSSASEVVFAVCAQTVALMPGLPGVFLRRAYYRYALESCSSQCHIGFGSFFTHRQVVVEDHVYIGNYATIGSAHLHHGCLVGSHASLLSGANLHAREEDGWGPADLSRLTKVDIGAGCWLGEGAIVMADVGTGAMVSAGAVVSSAVRDHVMVAGNPARFVKTLE